MKKAIFIIIVIFLSVSSSLIACGNNKSSEKANHLPTVVKIIMRYEDLDSETPIRIKCQSFESYFGKSVKEKLFLNSIDINEIINYINETKENKKTAQKIDVRFKIIIIYEDGTIKEICGNEIAVEIDALDYQISPNFSLYIKSVLK